MISSEGAGRIERRLFAAFLLSLLVHLAATWIATAVPRSRTEAPAERVARTDIIRIERATATPRPAPKHAATPFQRNPGATVHRAGPPGVAVAYDAQALAQMESQFRHTIADSRIDIQAAPAAVATSKKLSKYDLIMSGKPDDLVNFHGTCTSLREWSSGDQIDRYLQCAITYTDGYAETVAFPWTFHWPRNDDPFALHKHFAIQPPPDGFTLQPGTQLSRAVCIFFRERCAGIFAKEVDTGAPAR